MTPSSSSSSASPRPRRHEVEIYAHALRTRLQFASFKALNGVGKTSLSDLTSTPSTNVQPLAPSLASNNQPIDHSQSSSFSPATTPALSQGESLPSSSQSSTRSTRSIYLDIFGTDFRPSSSATPSSSKPFSRATSFASTSTPSKRPAPSTCTSTRSLLDKTASSPQLGSPERKNGRFDWHNNPTPAMVAHETKLAAQEPFALPTGSPSKRRREASHNASSSAGNLLNTPRRSRMQSGGFLPNGHPASSLAQDLGLTAPRTPRSRHASSGRHVFALQPQPLGGGEQDQAERDRVATTLAALAEARNNASSGSDSSSGGSDRPHTPPAAQQQQQQQQQGLGIFASPSVRRGGGAVASSAAGQGQGGGKRHKRNVSWSVLPTSAAEEEERREQERGEMDEAEEGEDRAAADYLLFLASSPSPSSIKRFSGDAEGVGSAGILSTPAQTSLWDPFQTSYHASSCGGGGGGNRRSRMQSGLGWPRHTNSAAVATPLTPPPSARKLVRPSMSSGETVGLGFDASTLSSASPSLDPSTPSANAEEYMLKRRCSNAPEEGSPRTPPPSTTFAARRDSSSSMSHFDYGGGGVTTPPNAPGAPGGDTSFSYADFVNVSPSPQPPSTGRFGGGLGYYAAMAAANSKTPTRVNRFRFDR